MTGIFSFTGELRQFSVCSTEKLKLFIKNNSYLHLNRCGFPVKFSYQHVKADRPTGVHTAVKSVITNQYFICFIHLNTNTKYSHYKYILLLYTGVKRRKIWKYFNNGASKINNSWKIHCSNYLLCQPSTSLFVRMDTPKTDQKAILKD